MIKDDDMNESQYVHYGCWMITPAGWRNFDASPTLRFERIPLIGKFYTKNESRFPGNVECGDIVKGLPVSPESAAGVYCSHVLEHLSLFDLRIALRNTAKILKPNGLFRLVVPDLAYLARQYVNNTDSDASLKFMKNTSLGVEKRNRSLYGFILDWLGNSRHLWLWDYKSLKVELESAGFTGIRRAVFGDSSDPMFLDVEERHRWENCLGIECIKPGKPTLQQKSL